MNKQPLVTKLPNLISFARIIGTPLALLLLWQLAISPSTQLHIITLTWIVVLCVSDFVDGWIARRFDCVSDLGKHLDPLADKCVVVLYLAMVQVGSIHFVPVALLLFRDLVVTMLRDLLSERGLRLAARLSGKFKTAVTFPVLCCLVAAWPLANSSLGQSLVSLHLSLYWISSLSIVFVSVWSLLDYLVAFYQLTNRNGLFADCE